MKLNSITCIGYNRVADGFIAILQDVDRDQILAIDTLSLTITADNDGIVETFTGFGTATRITEDLTQQRFEVFFPVEDLTHQRLRTLEMQYTALIAENKEIKDCIVEIANVTYA